MSMQRKGEELLLYQIPNTIHQPKTKIQRDWLPQGTSGTPKMEEITEKVWGGGGPEGKLFSVILLENFSQCKLLRRCTTKRGFWLSQLSEKAPTSATVSSIYFCQYIAGSASKDWTVQEGFGCCCCVWKDPTAGKLSFLEYSRVCNARVC